MRKWNSSSAYRVPTCEKLPRLDCNEELRNRILPLCRLSKGQVWEDPIRGHRVGVLDATDSSSVSRIMETKTAVLALNDPPYNVVLGGKPTKALGKCSLEEYIEFSRKWITNCLAHMAENSSFYLWVGADVNDGFQPLADIMLLLRSFKELKPRNFITLRNQRGYGTQKNWMWIRQELLYYVKGSPIFNVDAEYTDIPKILRGYYKWVKGDRKENLERSRSRTIRAGNVWVDVQQVFYRLEENVPGCYAQKPLKAIERIVAASSNKGDLVVDFFSHSGTTLIAGERLGRKVFTFDNDPIFAEITIRRLERYRQTGKTGWQWESPFPEIC
ncbi:MAG: site-specific DNA-methyltransferase [Spirochaetes bacterium]|nr:site-specific DNA-methyltransferase [Spirochaetota bacterium]